MYSHYLPQETADFRLDRISARSIWSRPATCKNSLRPAVKSEKGWHFRSVAELGELHRSAQLDLVQHAEQLRIVDLRTLVAERPRQGDQAVGRDAAQQQR